MQETENLRKINKNIQFMISVPTTQDPQSRKLQKTGEQ